MGGIASQAQLRMSFVRWALVTVPAVVLLGFLAGASVTAGEDSAWYRALAKPAFTPPGWAFPVAWSLLYILLGLALAMILNARGATGRGLAICLFVAQFALNLAWTPVFFGAHRVALALAIIVAMLALASATAWSFGRIRSLAGWLLVPYLAWLCFAAALNYGVLRLNPEAESLAPAARTSQML